MTYRPENLSFSQSIVATSLIFSIAFVVAVPVATAWVWHTLVRAFEGNALDFYDVADD